MLERLVKKLSENKDKIFLVGGELVGSAALLYPAYRYAKSGEIGKFILCGFASMLAAYSAGYYTARRPY